jgi:hypothetical protein
VRISAVIVSRLDHPLGEVIDSIAPHVSEIIIVRGIAGVWERWEGVSRACCEVCYIQDDDAIVDVPAVLAAYEPDRVTCNMPEDHRSDYPDGIALVGWGCVFDRADWHAPFEPYLKRWPSDDLFRRECDRVFTGCANLKLIDVPVRHLAHAHGSDRMGREARHRDDMREIRQRIYAVRGDK